MHLSLYVLSFESQFECVDFALESLIKLLNSSFKVAHCLEEGGSSSTIGHLNMLYGAHIRKIMKSKFGQACKDHKWLSLYHQKITHKDATMLAYKFERSKN
jgi:hypothetical protein